jgi:hypothetical protein
MKLKNIGTTSITIVGAPDLAAGAISANIDDTLARQLVAENRGALAIAPESEHTPEELEHADEKVHTEEPEVIEETDEEGRRKKKPGRDE